jgi:hypothetical protein
MPTTFDWPARGLECRIGQACDGVAWSRSRGFGAVGSALPWHGRGQGFESPKLHHRDESGHVRQMSRVIGYALAIGRGFLWLRQ